MLTLSQCTGVPVYRDKTAEVLTSYSYGRFVAPGRALAAPAYGPGGAIALAVEVDLRAHGLPLRGPGMNPQSLYARRSTPEGLSFLEAFEIMATEGFRIGPAIYYIKEGVLISGLRSVRAYIMHEGPVVGARAVAGGGYEAFCAIGYTAAGLEVVGPAGRGLIPWAAVQAGVKEIWGIRL